MSPERESPLPSSEAAPPPHSQRRPRGRKVVFSLFTVIVFFALLEVIGRALIPALPDNARWAHESSHVRLTGFPALNNLLESDVNRFWRLRAGIAPTQIIGRVGDDDLVFRVSTDEHGYRRTPAPATSDRSVLFLGDSCTLGIGVDDDQAIPSVMQGLISGARCINAGVPGYSAFQGRVYLESIVRDIRPAAVVINFGFNDDAAWDDRSDLQHAVALADPRGWHENLGLMRLIGRMTPTVSRSARPAAQSRPRLTDDEFADQIQSMINTCIENEARPLLIVWPLRQQASRPGLVGKQSTMLRIGQSRGVPVVDLLEAVRARPQSDKSLFADLLHFNEAGCRMAADLIAQALLPALGGAMTIPASHPLPAPAP